MKRGTLILVLALALVGLTGQAWAAETDTITITVSLPSIVSVSVTPDTWNIGAVGFNEFHGPLPVTIENDGTEYIGVSVRTTDGAGGWTAGTGPGENTFVIILSGGGMMMEKYLTTTDQFVDWFLTGSVVSTYQLDYQSPTMNSLPAGDQSFTVTFTAAIGVP